MMMIILVAVIIAIIIKETLFQSNLVAGQTQCLLKLQTKSNNTLGNDGLNNNHDNDASTWRTLYKGQRKIFFGILWTSSCTDSLKLTVII